MKFLEGTLEHAKHAESGRNALIKQIKKLDEEVKHSQHVLEKRHAEALVSLGPLVEQGNSAVFVITHLAKNRVRSLRVTCSHTVATGLG